MSPVLVKRRNSELALLEKLTKPAYDRRAPFTRTSQPPLDEARADTGFTQGTFCRLSGDFPLGGRRETRFPVCSPESKSSECPDVVWLRAGLIRAHGARVLDRGVTDL